MTTNFIGSTPGYQATIGNSTFAITNRIFELAQGDLPTDLTSENVSGGGLVYSFSAAGPNSSINKLYQQAEDIQFSLGALDKAAEDLEKVSTRLSIGKSLVNVLDQYKDLSDIQKENVAEQMNYVLGEIDQIAYSSNFQNVPLLDGKLEKNGTYLKLSGEDIDLTKAFKSVTSESLDLPYPGEFSLNDLNIEELKSTMDAALTKVDDQIQLAKDYGDDLFDAFDKIKSAIYSSSVLSTAQSSYNPNSLNPSSASNGNLVLTMGYLYGNISYDNSFYNNIDNLLNGK